LHNPYDVGCPARLARPRRLVVYADSMQRPSAKRNGRLLAAFKVGRLNALNALNRLKPLKLLGPSFAGHAVLMRARFLGAWHCLRSRLVFTGGAACAEDIPV
jgi:hypothetical protein